jgi:hypothetical protein
MSNMAPTPCPGSNYSACAKFSYQSSNSKAIYRGCAAKKLNDTCYPENNIIKTCFYWCDDEDGCNSSSKLTYNYLIYLTYLFIIPSGILF